MKVPIEIENLIPYSPGKPIEETKREYGLDQVIKLASNECNMGVSPYVVSKVKESIGEIFRYPDPSCYELIDKASSFFNVNKENILAGNGSNELIDLLIRTFCIKGQDRVLTSKGTFIAYSICAKAAQVSVDEVDLKEDFSYDLNGLMKAWTPSHKIVFLANPNNPTGKYIPHNQLLEFINFFKSKNTILVIDEAYFEYVRAQDFSTVLPLVEEYRDYLMVLRTFSKAYGLAGLRVGLLFGDAKLLNYVNRVRNPFNVSLVAQKAAVAALEDQEFVRKGVEKTWESLDYFYKTLRKLNLSFVESQTNFVFFDSKRDSNEIFKKLLKRGLVLRPMAGQGFKTFLRMNVGFADENEKAVKILLEELGES